MIKIGTDITSVKRISSAYKRFGQRFLERILTEQEMRYVLSQAPHTVSRVAGRFAAKEAASKMLGTGWHGIGWKEIEISRLPSGEPQLKLHGRAAAIAQSKRLDRFEVSISHEREFAISTVLAYGPADEP